MAITLTPEQEAWISAHVAAGDFASVEDAARRLIDERIVERDLEQDDLAWAKPPRGGDGPIRRRENHDA